MKFLIVLFLIFPYASTAASTATIKGSFESKSGNRAANLESNIRLLTVLALQQNGWTLYGNFWYKLFEMESMWIPAENFCQAIGGHLVSIKDKMENEFVHLLRKKNNIWIGLNKLNDSQQVFKWSDGSAAKYQNWDATQPNEPEVDCTYMQYHQDQRGTWFDYGCDEMRPQYFVCKLSSPGVHWK